MSNPSTVLRTGRPLRDSNDPAIHPSSTKADYGGQVVMAGLIGVAVPATAKL